MNAIDGINVEILELGHDSVSLVTAGLTDEKVLREFATTYPEGINLKGSNVGPVWLDFKRLLTLCSADGFGLEAVGIARTAADLCRLLANRAHAEELGPQNVDSIIHRFIEQSRSRSNAKRVNQLHAHRFGVGGKVVCTDWLEPGICHVGQDVWDRLCREIGQDPSDLHPVECYVLRHPFILGAVVTVTLDTNLTRSLIMLNRLFWRKANGGDVDGDTGNLFPIADKALALSLAMDINAVVPEYDSVLAVRGVTAHSADAEMWGEMSLNKLTEDKLTQSFAKTTDEWLAVHEQMASYYNKQTPIAYRISDICALMASVGVTGADIASMVGAVVEEHCYLSGSGSPAGDGKQLDAAMDVWMKGKINRDKIKVLLNGLRQFVDPDVLTTAVKNALLDGSLINKRNFAPDDPIGQIVMAGWMTGKGRGWYRLSTTMEPLKAMMVDPKLSDIVRDSFLAQMVFYAVRQLDGVVASALPPKRDNDDTDDAWGPDVEDIDDDVLWRD